ncbi:MAG: small, acid-soluble spore protein, alpha/beta type [Eubacteriales bacterium]|nr:small, acid-soluble spore protein, alpha/beta type [Eubacteriales bacterium]
MSGKKEKVIDLESLTSDEKVKYEIAEELGLLDRVLEHGWKSLSSKETGRIGGLMTKKKRENNNKNITNVN